MNWIRGPSEKYLNNLKEAKEKKEENNKNQSIISLSHPPLPEHNPPVDHRDSIVQKH